MKQGNYILINALSAGGAERQVSLLCQDLNFDEVILLENEVVYDVKIPISFLTNFNIKIGNILKTLLIPIYIFILIKKIKKPKMILSFLVRSNIINIIAGKILGYKIIISERNMPSQVYKKGLGYFYSSIIKYLYPFSDLIIVNSQGIKNDLINNFNIKSMKIEVINNAIDIENIEDKKEEDIDERYVKFFKNNKILINVGSLTEQKGQKYLLKMIKNIEQSKLVIIGEGKEKDNLIKLSKELNLKVFDINFNADLLDNSYDVVFLGFQKNPFKYLYSSNLFILTSYWEGFPNVLLEAMACSLPVVTSNCPSGPNEILTNENYNIYNELKHSDNGILLPIPNNENIGLWSIEINKLVSDSVKCKEYSLKSYKKSEKYTKKEIFSIWKKVLDK